MIDEDIGQAVARLAFISDPTENLTSNEHIAVRRLKDVCRKFGSDPAVADMISKGFKKLVDKGHIVIYDELSEDQKLLVDSEPNISFKPDSQSTPARPTFDASSKTPGPRWLKSQR